MINIKIIKKNSNLVDIEITGHSGYAESGKDIVCSAVSSIAQTLIIGLKQVLKLPAKCEIDEDIPLLSVSLNGLSQGEIKLAQTLMKTASLGLKEVRDGHAKYIKIKEISND